MPNRWIKEQYKTSERLEAAGAEGRDFWTRLVVTCDDHGRYLADPRLVASACFPLGPDVSKCEQLLALLVSTKLLVIYEVGGKSYLQLRQWYERPRSKSRYPSVPEVISNEINDEDNCEQLHADASLHARARLTSTSTITYKQEAGWEGIGPEETVLWAKAYPAISINVELAKAAAWLKANPKNLKSNYERFLTNWFSRAQDRAPRAPRSGPTSEGFKVAL